MSATSPKLPKFADTVDEAEKGPFPRTKSQASLVNRQDNELPNPPGAFPIRETNGKNGSDVQESRAKDVAKYTDLNADREGPFAADCAEDAKIWEQYMNQAKISDEELSKVLNSDLDSLLIFAGLFSAILSAFLIEVRKGLQEDLQAKTNDLLLTLIRIQQNPSSSVTLESSSFAPTLATIRINEFWFVSLILSLLSALGASLAKGWVMQYASRAPGVSASDACSRHRRFIGITRWHLQMIVQSLPILLHVAFFLFSAGLIILLQDDNAGIANLILSLVVMMAAIYIGSSLLPLIWSDCPFRTPVSILMHRLLKELTGFRNDSTASDIIKSQALSWMMQNSTDDSITLRTARAIAGLPATPEIQEALYASQVAALLVRGFAKHLKSSPKPHHDDPSQPSSLVIYLYAILRLVQTRHMDPEISPRLIELAKSGGSLDVDEKALDDGALKLVICVRARILLLLGDRTTEGGSENTLFDVQIPVVLKTSRPGSHTAYLLSEVYIMSHPDATKDGNILDMLRNEDVVIQRDGHGVILREARRIVTELDKISTFGIRKLLDGLTGNSIYLRQYYAQKMGDLAQNYGTFRRMLTKHIEIEKFSNLIQCDDEAIQSSTIKAISILANDAEIRQSFFTREMVIDLCQVTQKVKKPIKLQMISLQEILVEDKGIRAHLVADEAAATTKSLINDEDEDVRRVAIMYATKLAKDKMLCGKISGVGLATSIMDKLSDDDEGARVAAMSFVGELVQYRKLWTESRAHEAIAIAIDHVFDSKSATRVATQKKMIEIMKDDVIGSEYVTQEIITAVFNNLGDGDSDVRRGAVDVIDKLMEYEDIRSKYVTQEIVTAVFNSLGDEERSMGLGAVDVIGKLTEYDDIRSKYVTQEIVTAVFNKLDDGDSDVGRRAVYVIDKLMEYDEICSKYVTQEIVTAVFNKLGDGDSNVRRGAVDVMGTLMEYDDIRSKYVTQEIVTAVFNTLGDGSYGVRYGAVYVIGKLMGYDDIRSKYVTQEIVTAVFNKLGDGDSDMRRGAVDMIGKLMEYDDIRSKYVTQGIVTAVFDNLSDGPYGVLRGAVDVIEKLMGYDDTRSKYVAQEIVTAVFNNLGDGDSDVRRGAADVIGKLMKYDDLRSKYVTQEIVTAVFNKMGDGNSDVRRGAIYVIGKLMKYDDIRSKCVTQEIVSAVFNKLGDGNSDVRRGVVYVMGKLMEYDDIHSKYVTQEIVSAVFNKLGDGNLDVRHGAVYVIDKLMGYDDIRSKYVTQEIVTAVFNKLGDVDSDVRCVAVYVIDKLMEYEDIRSRYITQEIVTAVFNKLGDGDWDVRRGAVDMIGKLMGYDDIHSKYVTQEIVSAVFNKLGDGNSDMRRGAVYVIGKLMGYDDIRSKYVTQEIVTAVFNKLGHRHSDVRGRAVDVIGKLMEYEDIRSKYVTQEIVTAVFNKLGDANSDMRRGAVDVIGKLTEYDDIRSKYVTQGIVTAVFNKLGDGNSDVRLGAVDVIGRLKQYENFCMMVTAPEIIALISEGCGASNPDIQQSFLGMLSILEKLDLTSMVLTTIVNKLNDSNHSIQTAIVAFTLFAEQDLHIRSITPETIAAIITMMSHRDQAIQVSSIKILVNLSKYDHHHNLILATNVVEVTIDLLQSLNRDNRARAVQFLVNLRIASVKSPHFPRLISLFTDPNPEIVKSSLPILLQMAEQDLVFDDRTLQIWDAINRMLQEPRTGACAIQALKAFVMNATALHEIVYDSAIVPTLLRLLETRNSSGGELWHIGAEGLLILDKF